MKKTVLTFVMAAGLILTSASGPALANPCEKAKTLVENDLLKDGKGRIYRVLGQFLDGDYLIEDPETKKPTRLGFNEAQKYEQVGIAPLCGKLLSSK